MIASACTLWVWKMGQSLAVLPKELSICHFFMDDFTCFAMPWKKRKSNAVLAMDDRGRIKDY